MAFRNSSLRHLPRVVDQFGNEAGLLEGKAGSCVEDADVEDVIRTTFVTAVAFDGLDFILEGIFHLSSTA